METSRIEDILMDLCEPDTGLIDIGKYDHDVLKKALTEAHQAGIDEAVERVMKEVWNILNIRPVTPDGAISKAHLVAELKALNDTIEALQDNK